MIEEQVSNMISALNALQGGERVFAGFALSGIVLATIAGVLLLITWLFKLPSPSGGDVAFAYFAGLLPHFIVWSLFVIPGFATDGFMGAAITIFRVLLWVVGTFISYTLIVLLAGGIAYKIAKVRQ